VNVPGDRRIATPFGLLQVSVEVRPDGRTAARITGGPTVLSSIGGAIGTSEDEAVAQLVAMIERSGIEPRHVCYPARATRIRDGWSVVVEGVGVIQARDLNDAQVKVTDLVVAMRREPAAEVRVVMDIRPE
jgi:hypothetical protein